MQILEHYFIQTSEHDSHSLYDRILRDEDVSIDGEDGLMQICVESMLGLIYNHEFNNELDYSKGGEKEIEGFICSPGAILAL